MLTKLSQVQRDVNIPKVWRYEYFGSTGAAETAIPAVNTGAPGITILSNAVTVQEASLVKLSAVLTCKGVDAGTHIFIPTLWRSDTAQITLSLSYAPAAQAHECLSLEAVVSQAAGATVTYYLTCYHNDARATAAYWATLAIDVCRA